MHIGLSNFLESEHGKERFVAFVDSGSETAEKIAESVGGIRIDTEEHDTHSLCTAIEHALREVEGRKFLVVHGIEKLADSRKMKKVEQLMHTIGAKSKSHNCSVFLIKSENIEINQLLKKAADVKIRA